MSRQPARTGPSHRWATMLSGCSSTAKVAISRPSSCGETARPPYRMDPAARRTTAAHKADTTRTSVRIRSTTRRPLLRSACLVLFHMRMSAPFSRVPWKSTATRWSSAWKPRLPTEHPSLVADVAASCLSGPRSTGSCRAHRFMLNDASGPDIGPVRARSASGLRLLRRFRLAGAVEGDRLANERLEGGLVDFFSFVDVDRAAYVSVETRVEETGRILQRRALGEGELHDTSCRIRRCR